MGPRNIQPQTVRRLRLPTLLCALTIFLIVCGSSAEVCKAAPLPGNGAAMMLQTWCLIVPGNITGGTSVKGMVEIPGPPPPSNTTPPFKVSVMLNGWGVASPLAHYNYEKGVWEFDVVVPPGTAGGMLKVWIHPQIIDMPPISTERKIG